MTVTYRCPSVPLSGDVTDAIINGNDNELMYYLHNSSIHNQLSNCVHWHNIALNSSNVFAYSAITDIINLHKLKQRVNTQIKNKK